jgi:carboxymethylenebutenolidase
MRAAGRHPDLVAACAGFHGGRLVTDAPDSPHLELATAKAEFVFGHADNDGSMTPQDSDALAAALAAAHLEATNETYEGAPHGYTMSDTSSWNEAAFVRAFDNLRDLYTRTLR